MFNIIPLILIIISLTVIIVIITRKFPVLANLDLETVQSERENRMKEQIISNRLKRSIYKYSAKLMRFIRPLGNGIGGFFQWAYQKLIDFKENYNQEKGVDDAEAQSITKLFIEAEECVKAEESEKAEEKFIKIIGLDSHNIKAFKELGKLYCDRKDYHEAKETLEHALKLLEQDEADSIKSPDADAADRNNQIGCIYFELSEVMWLMDNLEGAMKNINQALKLEPNNPRYLDTKLQISIITKDKINALDAYERLEKINPENQKLDELKKQVEEFS